MKVSCNQCLPTFFVNGNKHFTKTKSGYFTWILISLYKLPSQQNYLCSSNTNTEAFHHRKAQSEVVPDHTMKAYIGNRGTALVILNPGVRWRWVLKVMPLPLHPTPHCHLHSPKQENSGTHWIGGWVAPELIWLIQRGKSLAPTGIWTSDHPASSQVTILTTLHRLHNKSSMLVKYFTARKFLLR